MRYWLFKSEPDEYSIDDLEAEPQGYGCWDGIRNYQARNLLRDEVQAGDGVLFYHSSCKIPGIVGTARVTKPAYADPAQFDADNRYFDCKATIEKPRWYCVDIAFTEKFATAITLKILKEQAPLQDMVLLKQGRLSIQPVTDKEWLYILTLAKKG